MKKLLLSVLTMLLLISVPVVVHAQQSDIASRCQIGPVVTQHFINGTTSTPLTTGADGSGFLLDVQPGTVVRPGAVSGNRTSVVVRAGGVDRAGFVLTSRISSRTIGGC